MGSENFYMKDCFWGSWPFKTTGDLGKNQGDIFMGTSDHILQKKDSISEQKKGYIFFVFKEKGSIISFSRVTFYTTLILMYETPKVEPGLGLWEK